MRSYCNLKGMLAPVLYLLLTCVTHGAAGNTGNEIDRETLFSVVGQTDKGVYDLSEEVALTISITNRGPKPGYIITGEGGLSSFPVAVKDGNGNEVGGQVGSATRPAPRHYTPRIGSRRIFLLPCVAIEPNETRTVIVSDALKHRRKQMLQGTYYIKPVPITIIHEVGTVVVRQDVRHPLWIAPGTIRAFQTYQAPEVEIQVNTPSSQINSGTSTSSSVENVTSSMMRTLGYRPTMIDTGVDV